MGNVYVCSSCGAQAESETALTKHNPDCTAFVNAKTCASCRHWGEFGPFGDYPQRNCKTVEKDRNRMRRETPILLLADTSMDELYTSPTFSCQFWEAK
jgi:hypothetical protein